MLLNRKACDTVLMTCRKVVRVREQMGKSVGHLIERVNIIVVENEGAGLGNSIDCTNLEQRVQLNDLSRDVCDSREQQILSIWS